MEGWRVSKPLYIVILTATLLMVLALGTASGEDPEHGPYFGEDSTPNEATTGDPLTFSIVCEGCTPKMAVNAIFHYGDGEEIVVSMAPVRGSFVWSITITVRDAPGFIHYHFGGFDSTGGWVYTAERTIPVIDNDPPVLVSDDSGTYAEPGKMFRFDFLLSDNDKVASARVDYWFDEGDHLRLFLKEEVEDRFAMSIDVPMDGVKRLYYTMYAEDRAGNFFQLTRRHVPVEVDMNRPTFGVDHSPETGTTGDEYKFSVGVKDDFELAEVRVIFSFGETESVTETMNGRRNFRFTITIPLDCQVDLSYRFYAVDASGNSNTTLWKQVPIIDDDAPVADAGDFTEVLVGEPSRLDGTGSTDNIGISSYSWTIHAYGEEIMLSGGTPTFTLTDPGDYNITLVVTDAAGNSDTDYLWVRALGSDPPPVDPPMSQSTQPLPIPGFLAFVVLIVFLFVTLAISRARYLREEP
jgi:hypothetical protein